MLKKTLSLILTVFMMLSLVPPVGIGAASVYETAVTLSDVPSYEWMKAIRGETKLTEITIPGTHDSCARKFYNDWLVSSAAKCQSMNIPEQLNAGIRFLDIRCECDSNHSVKTVHGSADCWDGNDYYWLDYVFQHIYTWLDAHPSETVLVSIKEDDGDAGAATFTSAIYEYIHGYGQGKYFYGEDYNYHDYWYLGKSVPTLDQVRGKCVLMNRFDQIIATSGSTASEEESGQKIKWGDYSDGTYTTPVYANVTNTNTGVGTFHVQDHYKWNTDSKKLATQEMLSLGHYRGEYYINFSSTVSDSTVPNPENLAGKVNSGYATFTYNKTKPSGIFAMDFATEELARYIILNNEGVSTLVSGTDGNISYTLNRLTGVLTLTGSGNMNNYAYTSANGVNGMGSTAPWGDQLKNALFDGQYNSDIITKIVVGDGITSIGDYAFYGFDHVTEVVLPSGITSIGEGAFAKCSSLENLDIHSNSVSSIGVYAFKDCTGMTAFYTSSSVLSIADNAFTNTPALTMYGEDGIYSQTYANDRQIPYVVTDCTMCNINAKVGSAVRESENPFANADLSHGVTISFSKYCSTDSGWNTSLINFSTGRNTDNRYFIIMANGTILFNDGNGGAGGWNGCYFDINSSTEVNTTSSQWVDIDITIDKAVNGKHILRYYVNGAPAKEYVLSDICASGYPYGFSGNDGIFSFLSSSDIKLYYGASFSIYPTMAGTADCYLDSVQFLNYAKTVDEITNTPSYAYLNTFTSSLGGTAVTGWQDNGKTVTLDLNDNDGRTGTASFPYTQNGGQYANYIATGTNPFYNADTSKGLTVSFWQRINGNYYGDLESVTFAKGDLDAKKYFCIGTDGYIRFNNGDGGSDPNLSSAGQYFDYTTANGDITNKVWQFVTVDIIDDYHFDIFINGELSESVTVTGASGYQANGGLLSFLTSGETSMYFGGYTAYWGTCTLSLDNVYCFTRALKPSEVYSLYMSETGTAINGFTNEFDSMPALYSGGCVNKNSFEGKNGVLYIPSGSCNSEITVYSGPSVLDDNSAVVSGSTVTVEYTGDKTVKGWVIVNSSGEVTGTGEASDTFTFTATQNSYVLCQLYYGPVLSGAVTSGYSGSDPITIQLFADGNETPAYETAVSGNSTGFLIGNIENGTYTLKAFKNNHVTFTSTLTINGSSATFDILIRQKGDVTLDGTVDVADISLIINSAVNKSALSAEKIEIGDMNGDGVIDAFDAAEIDRLFYLYG
ncbi:MAG: leucine-rich repeat protein [Clostridia bacterium]|nr:leucine-rich repeat protein [Clostridia bacterium]